MLEGAHIYMLLLFVKRENRDINLKKNIYIKKCPLYLARQKYFENWHGYSAEIPSRSKILLSSLHIARFSRYRHFCVLQKIKKIKNVRYIWRDKNILKIGMATLQRYPAGPKFC